MIIDIQLIDILCSITDPLEKRERLVDALKTQDLTAKDEDGNTLLYRLVGTLKDNPLQLQHITEVILDISDHPLLLLPHKDNQNVVTLAESLQLEEYLDFCATYHSIEHQKGRFRRACLQGDSALADILIAKFPATIACLNDTLFQDTLREGQLSMLEWFFSYGFIPSTTQSVHTIPLGEVISRNLPLLAGWLLQHGATSQEILSPEQLITACFEHQHFALYALLTNSYRDRLRNSQGASYQLPTPCDLHRCMMFGTEAEIHTFLTDRTKNRQTLTTLLNSYNNYGFTPLHMASLRGLKPIQERLIALGALPGKKDQSNGLTATELDASYFSPSVRELPGAVLPLLPYAGPILDAIPHFHAVLTGQDKTVRNAALKKALRYGANPFCIIDTTTGDSLLHKAVRYELLLTQKVIEDSVYIHMLSTNLHLQNKEGCTPADLAPLLRSSETPINDLLFEAIATDNPTRVKYAIHAGAHLMAKNTKGLTAFEIAEQLDLHEALGALRTIAGTYFLEASALGMKTFLEELAKVGVHLNITDSCNNNALHYALRGCRDLATIEWLLQQGVSLRTYNAEFKTPLDMANALSGTAVAMLIVTTESQLSNELKAAVFANNTEETERTLARGANPNYIARLGKRSLLLHEVEDKHYACAELLLEYGASLALKDAKGNTPLQHKNHEIRGKIQTLYVEYIQKRNAALLRAFEEGDVLQAVWLLQSGANKKQKTPTGESILHLAAKHGDETLLQLAYEQLFGDRIADISRSRDYAGNTPVHIAARYGNKKAVQFFIDKQCTLSCWNNKGIRPVDLAEKAGDTGLADLLRKTAKTSGTSPRLQDAKVAATFTDIVTDKEALRELCHAIKTHDIKRVQYLLETATLLQEEDAKETVWNALDRYGTPAIHVLFKETPRPTHEDKITPDLEEQKRILDEALKRKDLICIKAMLGEHPEDKDLLALDFRQNQKDLFVRLYTAIGKHLNNDTLPKDTWVFDAALETEDPAIIEYFFPYAVNTLAHHSKNNLLTALDCIVDFPLSTDVHPSAYKEKITLHTQLAKRLLAVCPAQTLEPHIWARNFEKAAKWAPPEIMITLLISIRTLGRSAEIDKAFSHALEYGNLDTAEWLSAYRKAPSPYVIEPSPHGLSSLTVSQAASRNRYTTEAMHAAVNRFSPSSLLPCAHGMYLSEHLFNSLSNVTSVIPIIGTILGETFSQVGRAASQDRVRDRELQEYYQSPAFWDKCSLKQLQEEVTNGLSLFHQVVEKGDSASIRYFIERGVDVDLEGKKGTALTLALDKQLPSVLRLLIEAGATNPGSKHQGTSLLHLVAPFASDALLTLLAQKSLYHEKRDKDGNTPLHITASTGNLNTMTWLIKQGASVHRFNDKGETPLTLVRQKKLQACTAFLTAHSIPLSAAELGTLLHEAARGNKAKVIEALLALGADINARDPITQDTALHQAIQAGSTYAVDMLCKKGASLSIPNSQGQTPYALRKTALPAIHTTLEKTHREQTEQFYYAMHHRLFLKAKEYLTQGANPNYVSIHTGNTALHDAVERGDRYAVKFLLNHGAAPDTRNVEYMTPVQTAQKGGPKAIRIALEEAMKSCSAIAL